MTTAEYDNQKNAANSADRDLARARAAQPDNPDLTPEQLATVDSFYAAEQDSSSSILNDIVAGRHSNSVAFVQPKTPESDGKATQLESVLSEIQSDGKRQNRFVMLGDKAVTAAYWRAMSDAGKVERNGVVNASMRESIEVYRAAARSVGVEVAGLAKIETSRSGWAAMNPFSRNHEIVVFAAGKPELLERAGTDIASLTERMVTAGIVQPSDIKQRPGQEFVSIKSEAPLHRLLTLCDGPVLAQQADEALAKETARDAKTSKPEKEKVDGKEVAPAPAPAAPAPAPLGPLSESDRDKIVELNQIFAQPMVATQLRGGATSKVHEPGDFNPAVVARALELYKAVGIENLRHSDVPQDVSLRITGGLAAVAIASTKAAEFGLDSRLPAVAEFVQSKDALVANFAETAKQHGVAPDLAQGPFAERFPEISGLTESQTRSRARGGRGPAVDLDWEASGTASEQYGQARVRAAEKAPVDHDWDESGLPSAQSQSRVRAAPEKAPDAPVATQAPAAQAAPAAAVKARAIDNGRER